MIDLNKFKKLISQIILFTSFEKVIFQGKTGKYLLQGQYLAIGPMDWVLEIAQIYCNVLQLINIAVSISQL